MPESLRQTVFDRCWGLVYDSPPPIKKDERVLNLREGDDVMLEALVEVIRITLNAHGCQRIEWDHPPSEPTQSTTPEALPLTDRLQKLYPNDPDSTERPPRTRDP